MVKVSVIGAGAWGTTLAILFSENGHAVTLWVYEKELVRGIKESRENKNFLPGFPLPSNIEITSDLKEAGNAEITVFAAPTQFSRKIVSAFKSYYRPESIVLSANKGIEEKTLSLPLDILKDELKTEKLAVLSGPNLSREVAKGQPAAAVAAAKDIRTAKAVQEALMLDRFRVYTNNDPIGVQLGGALKNVIAIAAGIADGLELGNNAKSGLMIRGISEITRLGAAMGAQAKTFAGLSGMGDLITTCSSKLSRNHRVGEEIAAGKKLSAILACMKEVAEGVPTARAALALGERHKVPMPITQEVFNVLYKGKNPYEAITDLMTRAATSE